MHQQEETENDAFKDMHFSTNEVLQDPEMVVSFVPNDYYRKTDARKRFKE